MLYIHAITSERQLTVIALDGCEAALWRERGLIVLLRVLGLLVATKALLTVLRHLRRLLITAILLISTLRCAVLGLLSGLRVVLASGIFLFAVTEVTVIGNNFCCSALIAVFVGIVAELKSARDYDHSTLAEILVNELAGASPSNAVDEIRLFLAAFLIVEITVNGYRKTGYRNSASGSAQFRVLGQPTHDGDMV